MAERTFDLKLCGAKGESESLELENVTVNTTLKDLITVINETCSIPNHRIAANVILRGKKYYIPNRALKWAEMSELSFWEWTEFLGSVPFGAAKARSSFTLHVKDIGPQVSFRFTYVVEYLGPLLIGLLWLSEEPSMGTTRPGLLATMYTLHFMKRILESIFVHRFSKPSLPFSRCLTNIIYYWGFSLCIIFEAFTRRTSHWSQHLDVSIYDYILVIFWVLTEIVNGLVHFEQARCPPPDGRYSPEDYAVRCLPDSCLFRFNICPNYTMEILGWIIFAILGRGLVVPWIFMVAGAKQMYDWCAAKYRLLVQYHPVPMRLRGMLIPAFGRKTSPRPEGQIPSSFKIKENPFPEADKLTTPLDFSPSMKIDKVYPDDLEPLKFNDE